MLQLKTNMLVDDPKTSEALKRQIKKLVFIHVGCIEFFVECYG